MAMLHCKPAHHWAAASALYSAYILIRVFFFGCRCIFQMWNLRLLQVVSKDHWPCKQAQGNMLYHSKYVHPLDTGPICPGAGECQGATMWPSIDMMASDAWLHMWNRFFSTQSWIHDCGFDKPLMPLYLAQVRSSNHLAVCTCRLSTAFSRIHVIFPSLGLWCC